MSKFGKLNKNIFFMCLFVLSALKAEPLLHFTKTDYYFENIKINNNEQIKIEIINNTGKSIDKFRIMTSCGCLKIKQENLPERLLKGTNDILVQVESGLLKEDTKDYTVFLHYDENKVISTKLHLKFMRTEGWQQNHDMSFFIGSIESWNLSKGKEIIFHFHCEKPDDYDFSIIPHDGNLSFQMRKKLIKPNLAEIVVITYPNMNWSPGTNDGKFHIQAKHKKTNKIIDSPVNTVIGNLDNGINQDEIKIINDSTFVLPVPKEQVQGVFGTYGKIAYTSNKLGKDLSEIRLNYEGRHSRTIIFELLKNGRQCYLKLANDKIPQKRISICKINQYGDRYKIESSKSKDLEIVPVDARQLRIERLDEHLYRLNGEGYFKITERLESYQFETFYYKTNERITEMD